MPRRREVLLSIVSVVLAVIAFAGLAELALRLLPVSSGLRTMAVTVESPVFRLTPNRDYVYSRDWDLVMVNHGRVNNAGFVNDRDYAKTGSTPVLAVIGDSYVEALMVPFADTLQGRLAGALEGKARVYSFAASGAPLSQYLVWAQYAVREYGAKALVINVVGNDFDESHISYRIASGFWIYAPGPDGALKLALAEYRPSLVRQMVSYSALARYLVFNVRVGQIALDIEEGWRRFIAPVPAPTAPQPTPTFAGNTVAEADAARVADSLRVIDAFLTDLGKMTGLPPDRVAFTLDGFRYPEAAAQGAATYFGRMRNEFKTRAAAKGYEVIDLDPEFQADYALNRRRFEFPRDGHWNATAHGIAADAVLRSRTVGQLAR
jgi:hypothetical protein